MKRFLALPLALIVAAGCGGGDGSSSRSPVAGNYAGTSKYETVQTGNVNEVYNNAPTTGSVARDGSFSFTILGSGSSRPNDFDRITGKISPIGAITQAAVAKTRLGVTQAQDPALVDGAGVGDLIDGSGSITITFGDSPDGAGQHRWTLTLQND